MAVTKALTDPAPDPATSVAPVAQPAGAVDGSLRWRYTGPIPRIYTHIPVTVATGDVIAWPDLPATDGAWESTTEPVSRQPDNHRPDPEEG